MTVSSTSGRPDRRRRRRGAGLLAAAVGLIGCSSIVGPIDRFTEGVGYYWQSITGHLELLWRAEPITDALAHDRLDPRTRQRLLLAQRIRRFAVTELGLPDNGSYTRFTALDRPFVTWGVVAAPELSLRLKQWCFPIAGCVTYRGYYTQSAAENYARRLEREGFDVQVSGVPAYSTLGWFDDPLLSTFINYPDAELARLVFHELSHQLVYVSGDSMFNESFATAVEQLGVERWLAYQGTPEQRLAWLQQRARRDEFLALLGRYRDRLATVYQTAAGDDEKRLQKQATFSALKNEFAQLRAGPWGGYAGYDRWFTRPIGNAHLGAIATYTTWVPAFRQLFIEVGQDFPRFYLKVAELAALDRAERQAYLIRRSAEPVPLDILESAAAAGADPAVSAATGTGGGPAAVLPGAGTSMPRPPQPGDDRG
ncbi:MAG: aminopeptidase [Lautropia sp.]